jgi:hypothetical protein
MASNITAPLGMTKADVLEGLWRCSAPTKTLDGVPNGKVIREKLEALSWESREKVEAFIRENPQIGFFGGRCIRVDMSTFPELDLSSYKNDCKIGMSFEEIFQKCLKNKS